MPQDPYTSDSGYVRFHLVRLVADKLNLEGRNTAEIVELLAALAAFVAAGAAMPDEESDEKGEPQQNITIVHQPGGYI